MLPQRTILVIGLGILIAILGAFAVVVEQAKAPSETEPARVQEAKMLTASSSPVTTATSTPEKPKPQTPKTPEPKTPTETNVTSVPQAITAPLGAEHATTSALALNEQVRAAVVNILCITGSGGPLNSISGSGVIIDPRGIILTNAHVAQYFLLKNYPT